MRTAGTAAIPLHLAYASDCEFAGTLGEMTFREIVELHLLPGSCADVCLRCKAACDEVLAF